MILLAVGYIVAAEVGNLLSVQATFSTFWPPAGLVLAVLLISERRDWPVLLIAAVVGNLSSDLLHGRPLLMTMGFSIANALEALVGATLMSRFIGSRPSLDSLRRVLVFTVVAAVAAPVVGASLGASVVMLSGAPAPWWSVWLSWWIGDVLGIIIVGSVIVSGVAGWDTYRQGRSDRSRNAMRRLAASIAIAIPFSVVSYTVFSPVGGTTWKFLTTPGVLAAGIVGGPLGAAVALLLIAVAGVTGMAGAAPDVALATQSVATGVFQAQAFFAVNGVAALALAGVIEENRRNAETAKEVASQFRSLFDTMREGVAYCHMIYDELGEPVDWVYLQVNKAFGDITALHDVTGRHVWELLPGLDESNPELYAAYGGVASSGVPTVLESHVPAIGQTLRISVTSPANGDFVAVFEDITHRVEQEQALLESNRRLEKMVYDVAEAMGTVVEARDPYTQGHEVRVASLGKRIAREMGLTDDAINEISMAGLLHDIGKLRVPAEILTKPGQLSVAEFALIKEHPEQGFDILSHIEFPWPIAEIVRQHHERLDGSGYPRGLSAEEVMLPARILAVADVVEAMASHRPYRPAVGLDEAITEISNHPERYDTQVVGACCRLYERGATGL